MDVPVTKNSKISKLKIFFFYKIKTPTNKTLSRQ